MSEFYKGFVITVEKNIHENNMGDFKKALSMIKGVVDVKPIKDQFFEDDIAKQQEKNRIRQAFWKFYNEILR